MVREQDAWARGSDLCYWCSHKASWQSSLPAGYTPGFRLQTLLFKSPRQRLASGVAWGKSLNPALNAHFIFMITVALYFSVSSPLRYSCLENPTDGGARWAVVHGVTKSQTRLSNFTFTFHFHALEKEMATHSSVRAWRIPGTAEPGGLLSMGSQRVRHNWAT